MITRAERDELRKWCRDMDAADGVVRDESPICIWEELLDALGAADALAAANERTRDAYNWLPSSIAVALDAYRALVAPSSTPDAAPPAERGEVGGAT